MAATRTQWFLVTLGLLAGQHGVLRGQTNSSSPFLKEHVVLKAEQGALDVIWSLSFSRDGKTLAAGLQDKTIRLWDLTTGKELPALREHTDVVRSVAFSPDGKLLASGSLDGTVRLWVWDINKTDDRGKLLASLNDHKDRVISVAFSPSGKLLASGSFDGTVKIWDVATRKVKMSLDAGNTPGMLPVTPRRTSSVAFSSNGRVVGAVAGDIGKLWDVNTGRALATLSIPGFPRPGELAFDGFGGAKKGERSESTAMFTAQGRSFATTWVGSKDRAPLKLWDTTTGKPRNLLQIKQVSFNVNPTGGFPVIDTAGSDVINTFCFSPDGRLVVTGGFEFPLTGKEKTAEEVNRVRDRVQNNVVYLVKFWDGARGNVLARLKGHEAVIRASAFSPDGTLLATGGNDRTVRVWLVKKALDEKK